MEDPVIRFCAFVFAIWFGWLFYDLLKGVIATFKSGESLLAAGPEGSQAVILLIALPTGSVLLLAYAFGFI